MNFLPTSAFTFSIRRYLGLLISIALRHSQRSPDLVPEPSVRPACLPAFEISVQGNEYVKRSKSGTSFQSIVQMSPKLGQCPCTASYACRAYLSISLIPTTSKSNSGFSAFTLLSAIACEPYPANDSNTLSGFSFVNSVIFLLCLSLK